MDKEGPILPNNVKIKWPAIILADRRTAKVKGRIILLIDSIQTIKGIKTLGVPKGTRWANICLVLLIHPYNIKVNQSGKEIVSVKIKWLVEVKIYGNKPKKLLITTNENKLIKIMVDSYWDDDLIKILNSLWRVLITKNHNIWGRLGIIQYNNGIKIKNNKELNQFRDKLKIEEEGSNAEKRLVIIFS